MSKMQRTKGATFERWVRRECEATVPFLGAKRGLQSAGAEGIADVTFGPYHLECKVGAQPPYLNALKQAIEDSKPSGKTPVAVCKRDRDLVVVLMTFADWLELVRKATEVSE